MGNAQETKKIENIYSPKNSIYSDIDWAEKFRALGRG